MHCKRLNISIEEWEQRTKDLSDRTVFQSAAWLSFLVETQHGEPIFAALCDGERAVGYFCGMLVRKFGVWILGSPMPGWTTAYMGFNMLESVSRQEATQALRRFAFEELRCAHLEMMDRRLVLEDVNSMECRSRQFRGFEIDLTQDEDELMRNMSGPCRTNIRKALRCGLQIRECSDAGFADQYHAQLEDVFAKRGLVPTYSKARVQAMIQHLSAEQKVLPLQAIDLDGRCIASMISVGENDTAFLWGSASWRQFQHFRPNELLIWSSIRHWKARGMHKFDMGGGGEYKRKYGGYEISVPWLRVSRYVGLESARAVAVRIIKAQQHLRGLSKNRKPGREQERSIPAA